MAGIEGFVCAPLQGARLLEASCGRRYVAANAGAEKRRQGDPTLRSLACVGCKVGLKHAVGKRVERWPDGSPVVRVTLTVSSNAAGATAAPPPITDRSDDAMKRAQVRRQTARRDPALRTGQPPKTRQEPAPRKDPTRKTRDVAVSPLEREAAALAPAPLKRKPGRPPKVRPPETAVEPPTSPVTAPGAPLPPPPSREPLQRHTAPPTGPDDRLAREDIDAWLAGGELPSASVPVPPAVAPAVPPEGKRGRGRPPGTGRPLSIPAEQRFRGNIFVVGGNAGTIVEHAKRLGVSHNVISERLRRGWSIEDACTMPRGTVLKKYGGVRATRSTRRIRSTDGPREILEAFGFTVEVQDETAGWMMLRARREA